MTGNKTFVEVTGTPTTNVAVTVTNGATGQILYLYNNCSANFDLTLNSQQVPQTMVKTFIYYGGNWILIGQ